MATWPAVLGVLDGEYLKEDVLNRPTRQLRERTDWLRLRIQDILGAGVYESLRLVDVPLSKTTGKTPEVKDFVYLNPVSKTFEKALASPDIFSSVYETAKDEAYSLGILVAKTGDVGTVVIEGRAYLSDTVEWVLSDLVENNKPFRPGPYYLSGVEPGKMTADPKGPAVYLGYFVDSNESTGIGGYAVLSPQYKDVGEAHIHRAFSLASKPSGTHIIQGTPPNAVHKIIGYQPPSTYDTYHGQHGGPDNSNLLIPLTDQLTEDAYVGLLVTNVTKNITGRVTANSADNIQVDGVLWDTNDQFYIEPRTNIVITGDYTHIGDTQYTLVLADGTSSYPDVFNGPGNAAINGDIGVKSLGFKEVFLHWLSSDAKEGYGKVRVTSYEVPVPFGTKGLKAVFENNLENAGVSNEYWNWAENSGNEIDRRKWTFSAPEDIKGWSARRYREFLNQNLAVDNGFSLIVFGGPLDNPKGKFSSVINVAAGKIYAYPISESYEPNDGDLFTVGAYTFEADNDSNVSEGHIPIVFGTGSFCEDLKDSINEANIPGVIAVSALTDDPGFMFLRVPNDITPDNGLSDLTETLLNSGVSLGLGGNSPLLVYNNDFESLITLPNDSNGFNGYWEEVDYYTPQLLNNNLKLMFIPFNTNGSPATSPVFTAGDIWTTEILDEVPGALFSYNVGFDQALARFYPPKPFNSCALSVNGIEQSNGDIHPDAASYKLGNDAIYWLVDKYAQVPWPANWLNIENPGTDLYTVHTTFYTVHMRINDTSYVTSLQPAPGSPIRVLRCGTNEPASTGDLMLDLDLNLNAVDAGLQDYRVVKDVSGTQLLRGPVVSRIRPGSGIIITSRPGQPDGQGEVTIGLAESAGFAGDFEEIALRNAKQEMIGKFPYIKLLGWQTGSNTNIPSGFTAKFTVPITLTGKFQVLVYMTLFGEANVPHLPDIINTRRFVGLNMSYSILKDYNPELDTDLDTYGTLLDNLIELPGSGYIPVSVPLGVASGDAYINEAFVYKAYDPMIIHNNTSDTFDDAGKIVRSLGIPFPTVGVLKGGVPSTSLNQVAVEPGSIVAIEFQRADLEDQTAQEYTNSIGVMKLRWRLVPIT